MFYPMAALFPSWQNHQTPCFHLSLWSNIPLIAHGAHGVVNVLYTVEMPLVENFLINECGMSRKTWTHMCSSYGPDAQPAAASDADDPTQPDYLQRSITNAVEFFMEAKYLDIVDVLRVRERGQTRNFNGVPVATHKFLSAMFEHTATMPKVAYKPKPNATDIVNVSQAASNLREILHALRAKGTIFLCLRRGRYCPEAVCAAQYVLRVLLQNAQHAQHVQNANNTRITRRTRRTRSTEF